MSRVRMVAGGAAILVGSQVVVTVVQVGTGAATARLLAPSAFGSFAAAMAITGLLGVMLTSATATAVLREDDLTPPRVWKLWRSGLRPGPCGCRCHLARSARVGRALSLAVGRALGPVAEIAEVGLAPLAVNRSGALLRRERRHWADAVTQGGSVIVGLVVGVAAVWTWREPVLRVVSPILASAGLLLGTVVLRRIRYPWAPPDCEWSVRRAEHADRAAEPLSFALSAVPVWLVSRVGDDHELGLFSRASAIPSMVVAAATVGLVRSVQPYYRSVARENQGAALRDLVVMTGAVGIPVMTLVAACAQPLITVWLGPAWVDGARYVPIVAAGSAAYLMFTLLANAAETLNHLREVRIAQLAMLPALLVVAVVSYALGSAQVAAATMLVLPCRSGRVGAGARPPGPEQPSGRLARDDHPARQRSGDWDRGMVVRPWHRRPFAVGVSGALWCIGWSPLRGHATPATRVESDAQPGPPARSSPVVVGRLAGGPPVKLAEVTAAGTGRRGAGLGNEVIAWGKSYAAAEALGLRLLAPRWLLNRYHLGAQLGIGRSEMLRAELAARLLPAVEVTKELYRATGHADYGEALVAARGEGRLDRSRVLVDLGYVGRVCRDRRRTSPAPRPAVRRTWRARAGGLRDQSFIGHRRAARAPGRLRWTRPLCRNLQPPGPHRLVRGPRPLPRGPARRRVLCRVHGHGRGGVAGVDRTARDPRGQGARRIGTDTGAGCARVLRPARLLGLQFLHVGGLPLRPALSVVRAAAHSGRRLRDDLG